MSINFSSTVNTNEIYKSAIGNAQKTVTTNTKEFKDSTYYVNQIKENIQNAEVTVKSMTASAVADYYNNWKNEPIRATAQIPEITISPKVLEQMKNDPKYAESLMSKIKDASTPQGFENAQLYEYKVIVKDDGQIEVLACADCMNGKNNTVSDDDDEKKKESKKKLKQLQFNRYSFENNKLESISEEKINKNMIPYDNYLLQNAMILKLKNNLL